MEPEPKESSMSAPLESIIDYDALANAVVREQQARGLNQKRIALAAGIEGSKLSNLLKHRGGLSVNNLFAICDWLGEPVDAYRVKQAPKWLVERLAAGNRLSLDEAQRLADERAGAARRQLVAADEVDSLSTDDVDAIVAAAGEAITHAH